MISERMEYSPIVDRRPFKLPDQARVAVWVVVNDDEPYPLKVKRGTLLALPYTVELNGIPII